MKKKAILALLCFSSLAIAQTQATATPVNISGKWALHSSIAGNESDSTCTFTQTGNNLTGSCAAEEQPAMNFTGTVDGNKVTFTAKGEYNGTPLTMKYTATVVDGKMKGDMTIDPFGVNGEFTATPAK